MWVPLCIIEHRSTSYVSGADAHKQKCNYFDQTKNIVVNQSFVNLGKPCMLDFPPCGSIEISYIPCSAILLVDLGAARRVGGMVGRALSTEPYHRIRRQPQLPSLQVLGVRSGLGWLNMNLD